MPTVAVIPVKSFSAGKQRLANAISPSARSRLGRAMVEHVAETVVSAGLIPVLVTADAEVATWATGRGIPSIPDPGEGLDAAATAGVRWATASNSSWLILHADLPLLSVGDVSRFMATAGDGEAIAPSSDGGTSAITAPGHLEFAFGPASFSRHLARMATPRVVALTGFLHDLDSPIDLESARAHPRGRWIETHLQ